MPDTGAPQKKKTRTNLDFYHSPTQLRFDAWHRLEENTSRLREKQMRKADIAALSKRIHEELTMLDIIEGYSAFPSDDDGSDAGDRVRVVLGVRRPGKALAAGIVGVDDGAIGAQAKVQATFRLLSGGRTGRGQCHGNSHYA